jgi:hypothetical protein
MGLFKCSAFAQAYLSSQSRDKGPMQMQYAVSHLSLT